jgi:hypothetical protein
VTVVPNADPVEVTFNVSRGGKPVDDLQLNLQTVAAGAGAFGSIKNGVTKITVFPGSYTYYVSEGSNEKSLAAVPESYHAGSMDRLLEIVDNSPIEIKLD